MGEAVHPLRAYREREQISAEELAQRLGVARNTIWRWESGRRSIERRFLKPIHDLTGISMADLAVAGLAEEGAS